MLCKIHEKTENIKTTENTFFVCEFESTYLTFPIP